MQKNHSSSNDQYPQIQKHAFNSLNARYNKKYTNQKLMTQESSSIKSNLFNTAKTIQHNNNKNMSIINESSKS